MPFVIPVKFDVLCPICMCLTFNPDGTVTTDRTKFSYERFIRELYKHSDPNNNDVEYWNIDSKIAKEIMLAFGFIPDPANDIGILIPNDGNDYIWKPKVYGRGTNNPPQFKYNYAIALRLMGWWDRFNCDLCHVEAAVQYNAWS